MPSGGASRPVGPTGELFLARGKEKWVLPPLSYQSFKYHRYFELNFCRLVLNYDGIMNLKI
jgi:hypothetical protein